MRWAPLLLLVAACSDPTPGEQALADLGQHLRAEADLVRQGEALHDIFEDCTDDCSGHRAGYLWALDQPDVIDETHCANASASFEAGCRKGIVAASFE
ncbi:hypothetical protein [Brevundimonas diminuta]|uniref:hypothetical protein n=1 Tax=Brevundimonas diminuta TaxID=293 RepID=UPI003D9A849A